jgi:hypothetical protein
MASKSIDIGLIPLSVKVYQVLLHTYPAKFQQEYGSQMVQVFQDCCLRAVRQAGTSGMFKLWAITLLDLIQSVISEHAQKEIQMKKEMKPEDARLAGWALMVGAMSFTIGVFLAFLSIRGANLWVPSGWLMIFLGMPLLVVGLLGVRDRYGEKVGGVGKNILLIGIIMGPLISSIGLIGGANEASWTLTYSGPAVLLACLTLFGFVAMYKKPLPRWNMVPVIAGIGYPIIFFFSSIPESMSASLIAIQGIALATLGYILKSDAPQDKTAPVNKELKLEDIKMAGWALVGTAILFVLITFMTLSPDSNWAGSAQFLLVFVILPLLVFGILGLRQRYGEKVGSFGKNILLTGAVLGPLTSLIGFFLLPVGPFWFITWTGPAVLFTCLTLFGAVSLNTRPMPRGNLLPVIAGLPYSVFIFSYIVTGSLSRNWPHSIFPNSAIMILIVTQGIALAALGYVLQSDVPEDTVVPA